MYRIPLSLLVTALLAAPWSNCQAAGSFQTRPAFSHTVNASYSTAPAIVSVTHAPAVEFGCGKGRVRDPATHGCRGPADIR